MDESGFKKKLTPEQYRVMRQKGTETPHTGKYWDHFKKGVYCCAACGSELFSSKDKFDAGTGWPAFRKPIDEKDLEFKQERSADRKVEIRCKRCKSHIGYVIADGRGPQYQLNSIALDFKEPAGWGFTDVKENIEKVQDTKEDAENLRSQDQADGQNDTSNSPALFMGLALALGGVLVGAGALAALVLSGPASFICRASSASYVAPATTTPKVLSPQAIPSRSPTSRPLSSAPS